MSGYELPIDTLLLAACSDSLNWLVWSKTKDGEKGINKPDSIFDALTKKKDKKENKNEIIAFNSADEFERMKQEILKGKEEIVNG